LEQCGNEETLGTGQIASNQEELNQTKDELSRCRVNLDGMVSNLLKCRKEKKKSDKATEKLEKKVEKLEKKIGDYQKGYAALSLQYETHMSRIRNHALETVCLCMEYITQFPSPGTPFDFDMFLSDGGEQGDECPISLSDLSEQDHNMIVQFNCSGRHRFCADMGLECLLTQRATGVGVSDLTCPKCKTSIYYRGEIRGWKMFNYDQE
jgi:hypothetical protein